MSETESKPQGSATRHGSSQLIMARYGLSTVPTTPPSPVIFDHRYFNLGMRYNNGIFIIDYPGYYRIDIKSYCYEGKTDRKWVGFNLMINSKRQLHQYSRWAAPSQAQRSMDSHTTFSQTSDLDLDKNRSPMWHGPCPLIFGQASAIFKLNAFDTVFVQMMDGGSDRGTLAQGAEMNNIQIEKLDWYHILKIIFSNLNRL